MVGFLWVATLRGVADPADHAAKLSALSCATFSGSVPGSRTSITPGVSNGRGLHEDAFGIALSVLTGSPLGGSPSPHPRALSEFPHLAPVDMTPSKLGRRVRSS
jgi:hypothetical protein